MNLGSYRPLWGMLPLLSFASLYDYLLLGLFTPPLSLPWFRYIIPLTPSLYEPLGAEQDHHCGQRGGGWLRHLEKQLLIP